MKLSNKLLIGFFGGAMIYMLMAFAEVRLRGDDRRLTGNNAKVESVPLANVRFINLNDLGKRINIESSYNPRIEMRSKDGDVLSGLKYELNGDTLTLTQLEVGEDVRISLTIYVPDNGSIGLSSNNARVYMSKLDVSAIAIMQTGGRIVFEDDVRLQRLMLQVGEDARFDLYSGEIDSVTLNMNNSSATIRSRIGLLDGFMANDSDLMIGSISEITFKKDNSSSIRLFD
ncbi:MAG: hypothetical protein RIM99_18885 [Cyclobacteriaceae bacterium]